MKSKKFLAVIAVLIGAVCCFAFAACGEKSDGPSPNNPEEQTESVEFLKFELLDDDTYAVFADKEKAEEAEEITIPSGYNGKTVSKIKGEGFYKLLKLKKVYISDGISKIGKKAFTLCENLEEIHLPDSLTEIGDYAFNKCVKLSGVIIPSKCDYIGSSAFAGCTELGSAVFSQTNGWKVYLSLSDTKGEAINVSSNVNNAENLKSAYSYYFWKRA